MSTYHHGNLRPVLVEAAVALGREKGPAGVVLREVARRTGVSHNAAYRLFSDRAELLDEVAAVGLAALADAMAARTKRVRHADPVRRARSRLRAVGTAYVEFAEHGSVELAGAGPKELLEEALDECVTVGLVPAEKRPGAELVCWSAVHGFSMLHLEGPMRGTPKAARDAELERLLDRLEEGLA